jgi:protein-tyrosine phosphatase
MPLLAPQRVLPLDGPLNFRDMGGYRSVDGRQTRWHTLFRADGLQQLTADDLLVLRPYELNTVIDLRTEPEIEARGQFPVDQYPVTFHNLSVVDKTWDRDDAQLRNLPAVEFLHRAYTRMLADGAARFAQGFRLLAEPDALPAVFHCAAGKDRTGLLAALLLSALGIEREQIISDYALTGQFMDQFIERVSARSPEIAEQVRNGPKAFFSADPDAMRRTLDDLDRSHGSVANFVNDIGVEADVMDRLRQTLLQ